MKLSRANLVTALLGCALGAQAQAPTRPIIDKLNATIVESLADPGVRTKLADLGQEIPPREQQTPEVLRAHHKAEIEKWWPIVRQAGIKVE